MSAAAAQGSGARGARTRRLAQLVLVAAVAVAYAGNLGGPFLFDDEAAIVANESLASLASALSPPADTSVAGRPVPNLTLALSRALSGLDPRAFRVGNLALLAACALVLAAVARRTFASERLSAVLREHAFGLGIATALLWGVHPLLAETVLYATQRTELCAGLSLLLVMWAYLRACDSARPRGWVALAVGASALGMASKAVMAAAPLLVLLHDRAFVAGSFRAALARRRGLYAGLAATWAILAALLATAPRAKSVGFGFDVGPLDYVAAQGPIVLGYLARAFWPAELVGDHGPLVATSLADTWPAVAAVGALVVASAVLAAVRPRLGYAGAWVFLLLGPSSSVVPIVTEVGADRRMLLPLAALVALAVALAWRLLARVARAGAARTAGEALLFAAAAVLLLRTRAAAEPYASALAFWRAAVVERPANPRAHYNFADVLRARGQDEAAMRELEETLRLSPRYTDAHVNLGGLYAASGQYARAVEHLGRAAELRPGSAGIRYNLGLAWGAAGRTDLAAEALSEAVRLDPAHRAARLALARALARLERAEEARAEVEELLRRDPDDREARELRRQLGR